MSVSWSNGKKEKIHRPYVAFHDFRVFTVQFLSKNVKACSISFHIDLYLGLTVGRILLWHGRLTFWHLSIR